MVIFITREGGHESNANCLHVIGANRSSLVRLDLEGGAAKGTADQKRPGIGYLCEFIHPGHGGTAVAALRDPGKRRLGFL